VLVVADRLQQAFLASGEESGTEHPVVEVRFDVLEGQGEVDDVDVAAGR
jgi:hypothetical protein